MRRGKGKMKESKKSFLQNKYERRNTREREREKEEEDEVWKEGRKRERQMKGRKMEKHK